MVHIGFSFFVVPDNAAPTAPLPTECPTVVWLRGEHDISTDGALIRTLAAAIALNDAPLVLDLSEVPLMSASTLGVIVAARKFLRPGSRSLTVRSPSAFVRRIISICSLDDLIGTGAEQPVVGEAIGSWVTIPVADRSGPVSERTRRRRDQPSMATAGVVVHAGELGPDEPDIA